MGTAGFDYDLMAFVRKFLKACDLPVAVSTGRDRLRPDPAKREKELDPPTNGFQRPKSVRDAYK